MPASETRLAVAEADGRRIDTTPATRIRQASDFRADIQGLRALAVSLVLLFHLWPNRLGGGYIGVDIFFVISGFLITSHLIARPPTSFGGLATFWARRIRRLLPASFLVLAVTLIASRLIAPETDWGQTAREIRSATLYVVNWSLAGSSTDYLAAADVPSPVQHFWSLSVEEQFYLAWPILILLLGLLARRRGLNSLKITTVGLGAVVGISFMYSVVATSQTPASAFFVTPTRIWELGVGGLVACLMTLRAQQQRRLLPFAAYGVPRSVSIAVGLGAIMFSAFTYSGATPFPGWHALVPVLGVALLIGIGAPSNPVPADGLLANRPAQILGDLSYSVYLWHWPMIVLLPHVSGGELGRLDKLVILLATLALAAFTKTYIEDRFRPLPKSGLRSTYVLAFIGMAILCAGTVVQQKEIDNRLSQQAATFEERLGSDPCFGVRALDPSAGCEPTTSDEVIPGPAQAKDEKPVEYGRACPQRDPFEGTRSCVSGDPDGDVSIALIGNSHAAHWLPGVELIAKQAGWKVTTYIASQCTPTMARWAPELWDDVRASEGCFEWGQRVRDKLLNDDFDLVLTSNSSGGLPEGADTRREALPIWEQGFRDYFKPIVESGVNVAVLRDTPMPETTIGNVPDCVARNTDDLSACSGMASDWIREDPTAHAIAGLKDPRATVIDMNDHLCAATRCTGVIGGVLAYYDGHHLTKAIVTTLAPYLEEPLTSTVERLTR
ncbi:MAG: acyltransferase [Kineosporiaceae bacterium]|nr:acyltransferase [Aeromicrobium sp.]